MNFKAVKGTRDFYPAEMRVRNWIADAWRRVSLRNGFEEYDAPIFEYLDLFTIKSGEEIAGQLFSFTDRGGRSLAIRPEITPSLARMVNAKINSLPRPVKWFSIPRLCRAENPQKGRLREFFQWNIDIIGEDSPAADAECVFVVVDALRELGLTADDVTVRYGSRALISEVLRGLAVSDADVPPVLAVLDKRNKIPAEAFEEMLKKVLPSESAAAVGRFLDVRTLGAATAETIAKSVGIAATDEISRALADLKQFEQFLESFGIAEWCRYDTNIVRGLAYYTGIVYEVFDTGQSLRAVAGGGRYDNLMEVLGGPRIGATGFGMGDVVLGILLDEKGRIPAEVRSQSLDFFVLADGDESVAKVIEVVGALREKGWAADYSYKRQGIGKQLKAANRRGAAGALIVQGDGDRLAIKNLATGSQADRRTKEFLDKLPPKSQQGLDSILGRDG